MPARWGLGPVFAFEWLTASRRQQMYAVRGLVVGVLLAALVIVWEAQLQRRRYANPQPLSYKDYGDIGELFFGAVVGTQLMLILLAAPGATAGAVCLDKQRGTLLHLLVTDLSAAEVVLGKLAARLVPVLGLIACSVPVLMICTLLGGLDPYAVAGAYAVMLGVGVFGAALALLLSVWGRKTHEVLLTVYLVETLWLLAYPVGLGLDAAVFKTGTPLEWLRDLNPFALTFAPYNRPGTVAWDDFAQFLLVTLGAAAACTLLAVVCVRPLTLRHGAVTARPKAAPARARRWGPALDRNPLLWYEWHRKRPSRWVRFVWAVYVLGAAGGTALVVYSLWANWGTGRFGGGATAVNMLQVPLGLLLVGVGAVTALADERVRGQLDVLLATPLPTRAIVWAKWRAAFRPVLRLAVLPTLLVAALVWAQGYGWVPPTAGQGPRHWLTAWLAWLVVLAGRTGGGASPWANLVTVWSSGFGGAFLTSLGLALGTWVARTGRAIGYWVSLYALQCLAWPFFIILMTPPGTRSEADRIGPALASPFFGSGVLTEMLEHGRYAGQYGRTSELVTIAGWCVLWMVVLLGAAAVLYYLTLLSFNRCLGRVSERGHFHSRFAGGRNGSTETGN